MDADAELLFQNEFIKDSEDPFAVAIHAAQRVAETIFVASRVKPFIQHGAGDVDIAAKIIGCMAAQEESVEDGGFALRGKRIDIFGGDHNASYETVSYYEIGLL